MTSDTGITTEQDIRRIVREEIQRAFAKDPATRKAAIVASKGTLDWAYPPLILASAAAAIGMDASVFFTFYGLNIIHKDAARKLKIDPVGNPAMPTPVPIPDIISALPGMVPAASAMMRARFARNNVATIAELLATAQGAGVRLIACQMTVDVFGYQPGDFIAGVEFAGATAFMAQARRAHVTMFIWPRRPPLPDITEDTLVDARDLMCPMPVMAATKAMRRLAPGQVLKVLATDRGSLADIPAWAEENGDGLLSSGQDGGVFVFVVRKAAGE